MMSVALSSVSWTWKKWSISSFVQVPNGNALLNMSDVGASHLSTSKWSSKSKSKECKATLGNSALCISKGVTILSRSIHVYTKSASFRDRQSPLSGTQIGYLQFETASFLYKGFSSSVGNKLVSTLLPLRCLKPHRRRKASCNPFQGHRTHPLHWLFDDPDC